MTFLICAKRDKIVFHELAACKKFFIDVNDSVSFLFVMTSLSLHAYILGECIQTRSISPFSTFSLAPSPSLARCSSLFLPPHSMCILSMKQTEPSVTVSFYFFWSHWKSCFFCLLYIASVLRFVVSYFFVFRLQNVLSPQCSLTANFLICDYRAFETIAKRLVVSCNFFLYSFSCCCSLRS